MASGRKWWRTRLARLSREPALNRAGRRQLRKLLGRAYRCEWRVMGLQRRRDGSRSAPRDALNLAIVMRVHRDGHVAERLRAEAGRQPQ